MYLTELQAFLLGGTFIILVYLAIMGMLTIFLGKAEQLVEHRERVDRYRNAEFQHEDQSQ